MVEMKSIHSAGIKKSPKKRKRETASAIVPKSMKLELHDATVTTPLLKHNTAVQKTKLIKAELDNPAMQVIGVRYPILKDEELVQKFLAVPLTNNQKGRIRQVLKDNLKGTSDSLLPDVIHNRIQAILKSSEHLVDTDLRKIRILYNMLKTAIVAEKNSKEKKVADKKSAEKNKKLKKLMKEEGQSKDKDIVKEKTEIKTEKKEQLVKKEKGKKRYVVFLGNLPLEVTKEMIMNHFAEMNEHILNIRIPKPKEDKKSAFAYVELRNEPTYELALSKHHSMLGKKRINVLYTTQKNGKITKAEAKSKSAKLLALQRTGKLIGSTPLNKKRSQRRLKLKKARAQQEKENNLTLQTTY